MGLRRQLVQAPVQLFPSSMVPLEAANSASISPQAWTVGMLVLLLVRRAEAMEVRPTRLLH
jgi:hypothetical protein